MRIVIIGGTGLIGSKIVARLQVRGHEAVAAAPSTGVKTLTGEGVKEVLREADVVVDVSGSRASDDDEVMNFFRTTTENLVEAARDAGAGHYVALSAVGSDRLDSGYFRAKAMQEKLVRESGLQFTLVRSCPFFEFAASVADDATENTRVRLSDAGVRPIAADDVADVVSQTAADEAFNGVVEIGGPEVFGLAAWIRTVLIARGDSRVVVVDQQARYFDAVLKTDSLLPDGDGWITGTRLINWLAGQ